ncbi:Glycine N-acyltransferase [Liparis tanakae]|uniref:Glycine N-acyltransferase-like protein n=1 Tax=Liparis tanakae TaxID=230148 RepID=A0A4Z2IY82_9TELE|nr:Glycine N-acyltransferase [Liparis tanakae]
MLWTPADAGPAFSRKRLPLPISILDESHAALVFTHLPYVGGRESLNHVRVCIRHLPNPCVTDEEGRPVSWLLSDELCELRTAFALPEHRRAGHLLAPSLALIRRMTSAGLPVYCNINQQNQATTNAVTKPLLVPKGGPNLAEQLGAFGHVTREMLQSSHHHSTKFMCSLKWSKVTRSALNNTGCDHRCLQLVTRGSNEAAAWVAGAVDQRF